MDQGILDNSFEQLVVEVAFSSPTFVWQNCNVLCFMVIWGEASPFQSVLMLSIAGSGRIDRWHLQSFARPASASQFDYQCFRVWL